MIAKHAAQRKAGAAMAHARNLDGRVGRAFLVDDVVRVVLKIEVVARVHVHQVRGDLFPVPSHGYITSNSMTGLPRRRA